MSICGCVKLCLCQVVIVSSYDCLDFVQICVWSVKFSDR